MFLHLRHPPGPLSLHLIPPTSQFKQLPLTLNCQNRGKTRLAKWYAPYSVSHSEAHQFLLLFPFLSQHRSISATDTLTARKQPIDQLTNIRGRGNKTGRRENKTQRRSPPPHRAPRPKTPIQLRRVPRLKDRVSALRRVILLCVRRRQ